MSPTPSQRRKLRRQRAATSQQHYFHTTLLGCSCPDYERFAPDQPSYKCSHMLALEEHLRRSGQELKAGRPWKGD